MTIKEKQAQIEKWYGYPIVQVGQIPPEVIDMLNDLAKLGVLKKGRTKRGTATWDRIERVNGKANHR